MFNGQGGSMTLGHRFAKREWGKSETRCVRMTWRPLPVLKIRNCGQIFTWPVQNGSNFNFPSYEPLLLQDPAIHILPCSAHFTQLSPFYPAMPVLPFYVHFTLLYPFYPSMSNSPSYFHFTLLCPFYPAIFTLLCPFYPFMSLSASYAHFTLLCPFYPAMSILLCNVHLGNTSKLVTAGSSQLQWTGWNWN